MGKREPEVVCAAIDEPSEMRCSCAIQSGVRFIRLIAAVIAVRTTT